MRSVIHLKCNDNTFFQAENVELGKDDNGLPRNSLCVEIEVESSNDCDYKLKCSKGTKTFEYTCTADMIKNNIACLNIDESFFASGGDTNLTIYRISKSGANTVLINLPISQPYSLTNQMNWFLKIENEILTLTGGLPNDTGWVKLELKGDFLPYGNKEANIPQYRRVGSLVEIKGVVTPASNSNTLNSANETTICVIPEEIRPGLNTDVICQGTSTNIWLVSLKATTGELNACRYRNSSSYPSTAPVNGVWLPFHIMYFLD